MTHISDDLDHICIKWCPIMDNCSREYECGNRIKLRRIIIEIAGMKDEED